MPLGGDEKNIVFLSHNMTVADPLTSQPWDTARFTKEEA